jgi:nucleotide sugar dehydrogenase
MDMSSKEIEKGIRRGEQKLCVIDLTRIGLSVACLFAEVGAKVIGVDSNLHIVKTVSSGKSPFNEPKLQDLIEKYTNSGNLTVISDLKAAISQCEIILLFVQPSINFKKNPDYSTLEKVCKDMGLALKKGSMVILGNTVAPGINETLVKATIEKVSGFKAGMDFGLAYSPIRASTGQIFQDILNCRHIIAGINETSFEKAYSILSLVFKGGLIKVESIRTAEATKIFEMIYRDVNIALANELAKFCEKEELNYGEVARAANTQPFCHLHRPGIVGGKGLTVTPYFLIHEAENMDVDVQLIKTARKINEQLDRHIVKNIVNTLKECGKGIKRSKILVLGVSFKANVKEDSSSPSRLISELLKKRGAKVSVWDPLYKASELRELGYNVNLTFDEALEEADCIVITVGHEEIKNLKSKILSKLDRKGKRAVVDCSGSNIFDPKDSTERVICSSIGVGRP